MSKKPDYCKDCRLVHEMMDKPTPCPGCENDPPEPDPENYLFEHVYALAFTARGGYGEISYDALALIAEAEGCNKDEIGDILTKAALVEPLVQKKQVEKAKQEMADKQNGR